MKMVDTMSADMRCKNCMYIDGNTCRRHAPTLGFPIVDPNKDWCAEGAIQKNKSNTALGLPSDLEKTIESIPPEKLNGILNKILKDIKEA